MTDRMVIKIHQMAGAMAPVAPVSYLDGDELGHDPASKRTFLRAQRQSLPGGRLAAKNGGPTYRHFNICANARPRWLTVSFCSGGASANVS
jgi:hypothetical protein